MSKDSSELTSTEKIYCLAVGTVVIALMLVIAVIAATKDRMWAVPAYVLVFTNLALFLGGVGKEVSYRRWPIPTMIILCTILSGTIGILCTLSLLIHPR